MRREATMDTMADIKYFDTNTITKPTSKQMLCYNHKIEYVKAWTPIAPRPRQITFLLTSRLCPLSVLCHKCDIWNQNLWAIFKDNKCPSLLAALAYKYTKKAKYMFIIEHK